MADSAPLATLKPVRSIPDGKELKALLERKPGIAGVRKRFDGHERPADPKQPDKVVFYWKVVSGRAWQDCTVICKVESGVVVDFRILDGDSASR